MLNKRGEKNGALITAVVVIIGIVAVLGAIKYDWIPGIGSAGGDAGDGSSDGSGTAVIQSLPSAVTLTYNDQDKYDKTNDPASKLRFYSPDKGVVADDGSITSLNLNSQYLVIAGNGSTTFYAQADTIDSGNKGTYDYQPLLEKASALSVTVVNDDLITKNSAANYQVINASDQRDVTLTYKATALQSWGSPDAAGKSLVVIQYDGSKLQSVTIPGASLASNPRIFNYFNTSYTASSAYYLDNAQNGAKKELTVRLKSLSGTDPLGATGPVKFNFYDANVDIDESTRDIIRGVEDESNNQLSLQPTNVSLFIG